MVEGSDRVGGGYYDAQWLKSRVTLSLLLFATARSGFPSPLKSAAATELGPLPTAVTRPNLGF